MIALLAASLLLQPITSEPTQAEVDALEFCIGQAPVGQGAALCEGLVAQPCLNTAAGMTTAGSIACIARELSIWDHELNRNCIGFREQLSEDEATTRFDQLQRAQRAWMTYRDLECDQQSLVYEGGTLALMLRIACINELTAERASDLCVQWLEIQN